MPKSWKKIEPKSKIIKEFINNSNKKISLFSKKIRNCLNFTVTKILPLAIPVIAVVAVLPKVIETVTKVIIPSIKKSIINQASKRSNLRIIKQNNINLLIEKNKENISSNDHYNTKYTYNDNNKDNNNKDNDNNYIRKFNNKFDNKIDNKNTNNNNKHIASNTDKISSKEIISLPISSSNIDYRSLNKVLKLSFFERLFKK